MKLNPNHKQLQALVKRRHPLYEAMKPHWDFMELCYEGGRAWFKDNIFQYHKEGEGEFKNRQKRAYRFNHTREIVDLVTKYLFRAEIARRKDDTDERITQFWQRATRDGLSIDEFMRVAATRSSIFGKPWIVVDRSSVGEPAAGSAAGKRSKRDDQRSETYAYLVDPQDVLDYSMGDDGRLSWVLIREWVRDDNDPLNSTGNVEPRYRLWTSEGWLLVQHKRGKDGKPLQTIEYVDSGDYDLGEPPVIPANNMISNDPWTTPALIADIAYLDRAVTNYLSNLDAIIQDQTFSQLAMPAQGLLPGDDEYKKLLEMGTKRVFLYDGEGGGAPSYLSPDPRQAHLVLEVVKQIISEIYHSVGLAGERTKQDNSKGIDNSSGVAKQNDFERVNSLLISKGDAMELVENQIVRLVCLWNGVTTPETDLVSYADDFDARGLFDEFDISSKLSLIQAPPQLRGVQMKRIVEKLFPNLSEKLIEELKGSVDEWVKAEEQAQEALPGTSDVASAERARLAEEARRDRQGAAEAGANTKARQVSRTPEGEGKAK